MSDQADQNHRMILARRSLEGLSLGDAFGQKFFVEHQQAFRLIESQELPSKPWYYTDDTVMALSIVETLEQFGQIEQEYLVQAFARRYFEQPDRGYGGTVQQIFRDIQQGISWQEAAASVFSGMGSMGNGGAMRSGPIGAYFFDNFGQVVAEARKSAEVTHSHPEGQVGAIAVAVATACAVLGILAPDKFLETVLRHTPKGETHSRIRRALAIAPDAHPELLITRLGNGSRLCAYDTVPISLWFAAHYSNDFEEAMWQAVSALGDRDTICAIVGSIVALAVINEPLPSLWLESRESLSGSQA